MNATNACIVVNFLLVYRISWIGWIANWKISFKKRSVNIFSCMTFFSFSFVSHLSLLAFGHFWNAFFLFLLSWIHVIILWPRIRPQHSIIIMLLCSSFGRCFACYEQKKKMKRRWLNEISQQEENRSNVCTYFCCILCIDLIRDSCFLTNRWIGVCQTWNSKLILLNRTVFCRFEMEPEPDSEEQL